MKLKKDMKVRLESKNHVLMVYSKNKTPFFIENVVGDGKDAFVTLRFENGEKLKAVVYGHEIVPFI